MQPTIALKQYSGKFKERNKQRGSSNKRPQRTAARAFQETRTQKGVSL